MVAVGAHQVLLASAASEARGKQGVAVEDAQGVFLAGNGLDLRPDVLEGLRRGHPPHQPERSQDVGDVVETSAAGPQSLPVLARLADEHPRGVVQGNHVGLRTNQKQHKKLLTQDSKRLLSPCICFLSITLETGFDALRKLEVVIEVLQGLQLRPDV